VLQRELESIKELHDEEPDSKWCMNALAHYHLLSARLPSISADEAARHRADAKTILERLEVIDEDRKERYRELASQC
jgi:geranylgeranyl transferase type-2 subunit alpha